ISAGLRHTCALFTDVGRIKCWGSNSYGQIGDTGGANVNVGAVAGEMGTNLPFVDFGENPKVVAMQTGSMHTCVLFANGNLKCFGYNGNGQLGLGDSTHRNTGDYLADTNSSTGFADVGTGRTVVSMHLGEHHTCVVLDNSQVKCFGHNSRGSLGLGDSMNRGDGAGEMGDFLPAVDFGTNRYAVRVFNSGGRTMCALLNTAELKCWGDNYEYVLGMGISKDVFIGGNPGEMGDNLVAITLPTGETVVNLWVVTHVVVIFDDHTMTAWGRTGGGYQLGNMIDAPVGDDLSDMGNNLTIIDLGTGRKPVQAML
ncbi:regulator of chromosome condensation 1/beta-lactamase-inhibitor protein II, partial [Baffinella frigidus]